MVYFYRRAYAIAEAGLDPRHPLLATSRSNLADFCQARGVPLEDWARVGASQVPQTPAAPQVLPRTSPMSPATPALQPVAPAVSSRRAFAAVVAVLAVLATLAVARLWLMPARGSDPPRADAPTTATLDPPVPAPAPAPVSAAVTPASLTPQAPSASQAATTASGASASADLRVVTATVCHTLTTDGAWRCEAAGPVSAPGRLSYYTRIASSHATRVRHRWYLGDRLRHEAALTVSANPGTGYRTFSRLTVSPGQWRVELLASGGAVLDETRFEVR